MPKVNAFQVKKAKFVDKKIVVSDHALSRAHQRFSSDKIERDHILSEIKSAIQNGRVFDRKPPAFRFFGEPAKMPGERMYFFLSANGQYGWIGRLDENHVVVVTSLRRLASNAQALKVR